jgi:hypothetical protein
MERREHGEHRITGRTSLRGRVRAAIVCLGICGLFVALWFAAGHDFSLTPGGCGFEQRYNLPCPTCGWTRSVYAFARGNLWKSFYLQPAAGFVCTVFVLVGVLSLISAVFGVYFEFFERLRREIRFRWWIVALVVIVVAGWLVTLARALAVNGT